MKMIRRNLRGVNVGGDGNRDDEDEWMRYQKVDPALN